MFYPKKAINNVLARVLIANVDGTSGDGVILRVFVGDFNPLEINSYTSMTEVYNYDVGIIKVMTELNFTIPPVGINQAVVFQLDYKATANSDTISMRLWITADSNSTAEELSFTETQTNTVLPSNGFVAWNEHLGYLAYSGNLQDGAIAADYSKSEFSTFARSRSGVQTISNIRTDGAVAFENGDDLYFADVTEVRKDDKFILSSPAKVNGHVHLVNQSSFEIKVTTPDDLRHRITVVYAGFPASFLGGHAQLYGNGLTVETINNALGAAAVVDVHNSGTAIEIDITAGQTVRVAYNVPATTPDGTVIPPAGSTPKGTNPPDSSPSLSNVSSASTAAILLLGYVLSSIVILC